MLQQRVNTVLRFTAAGDILLVELKKEDSAEKKSHIAKNALEKFNDALKWERDQTKKNIIQRKIDECNKHINIELAEVANNCSSTPQKSSSVENTKGATEKEEKTATAPSASVSTEVVTFEMIAGMQEVKNALKEAFVYPMQFPIFLQSGYQPPNALLLYGPPGTGKTQLAKAVAHSLKFPFFTAAPDLIMNKYQGDSEKAVTAFFKEAREKGPSILFIDEVDSMLTERSDKDSESSNRVKSGFLTNLTDNSLVNGMWQFFFLAATNNPDKLDPAFVRRFTRMIYVPLPDKPTRINLFNIKLAGIKHSLTENDIEALAEMTEGYSGSDISKYVADVIAQPFRRYVSSNHFKKTTTNEIEQFIPCDADDKEAISMNITQITDGQILLNPANLQDFIDRKDFNKQTVRKETLKRYEDFTKVFGVSG